MATTCNPLNYNSSATHFDNHSNVCRQRRIAMGSHYEYLWGKSGMLNIEDRGETAIKSLVTCSFFKTRHESLLGNIVTDAENVELF